MVANALITTLSQQDRDLLNALLQTRLDFTAVAAQHNLAADALIDWSEQSHIRTRLDSMQSLADRTLRFRATHARVRAIDSLEKLVGSTTDPIELRRASASLARATVHTPTAVRALPRGRRPDGPDAAPDLPEPEFTPAPDLSPRDLVHGVMRSLQENDDPEDNTGVATLAACLAPGATIAGQPIHDATTAVHGPLADIIDCIQPTTTEEENDGRNAQIDASIVLDNRVRPFRSYSFFLTR